MVEYRYMETDIDICYEPIEPIYDQLAIVLQASACDDLPVIEG